MQVAAGGAGGAGGGAGGAGGPVQHPTEDSYSNDTNFGQALNFQAFKEKCHSKNSGVFLIHVGQSFLKDFKNTRVVDFLAEIHMQYLFIMETKIIPSAYTVADYNGGLFNPNDLHNPFNQFKRWIVAPVLAKHGGNFPPGVLTEGAMASQAAQNWLATINYNN